jgi:hypothetical protein
LPAVVISTRPRPYQEVEPIWVGVAAGQYLRPHRERAIDVLVDGFEQVVHADAPEADMVPEGQTVRLLDTQ